MLHQKLIAGAPVHDSTACATHAEFTGARRRFHFAAISIPRHAHALT